MFTIISKVLEVVKVKKSNCWSCGEDLDNLFINDFLKYPSVLQEAQDSIASFSLSIHPSHNPVQSIQQDILTSSVEEKYHSRILLPL